MTINREINKSYYVLKCIFHAEGSKTVNFIINKYQKRKKGEGERERRNSLKDCKIREIKIKMAPKYAQAI